MATATAKELRRQYMREYRKRYASTPEGRQKKREGNKRWKKSENGKKAAREWAKKKYVAHPLPKLSDEQLRANRAEGNRRYHVKNSDVKKKRHREDMQHLRKYGLSKEQYLAMAEAQRHRCAICDNPPRQKSGNGKGAHRHLCVDHDHKTGKIRGLLCDNCNKGIGNLKDDAGIIFKALLYLRRH